MEVAARAQSRAGFEDVAEQAFGGARRDGGLQDDGGVGAQPDGEGAGGVGDGGEVEGPVGAEGGRGAEDGGADPAEFGGVVGGAEAAREHPADLGDGERTVGRGAPGGEFGGGQRIGVVADGADARGGGGLGEGESVVAEADDGEISGHGGWAVLPSSRRGREVQARWAERVARNVRLGVNMTDVSH